MIPKAFNLKEAEAYFTQGCKCVACVRGEHEEDCECVEDARIFFDESKPITIAAGIC